MVKTSHNELYYWDCFKSGNREAFAVIYNTNIKGLLRYGYKICDNEDVLKDTIQDLFIELWNYRENLVTPDSIKFYLFKSLRYKLIRTEKIILKTARENNIEKEEFDLNIENKIIERELHDSYVAQLQCAFNKLSKKQQEAIQLRFYEGFSNEQIAELMQINYQSASNLIHRALTRIKEQFTASRMAIVQFIIFILMRFF